MPRYNSTGRPRAGPWRSAAAVAFALVLLALVGPPAPRAWAAPSDYRREAPAKEEPEEPAAWVGDEPWGWEIGLTPALGFDIRDMGRPEQDFALLYDGTLSVGFRYQREPDEPHCDGHGLCIMAALGTALKGVAIGNQYGADLRLRAFRMRDTTWLGVALKPQILLAWGDEGDDPFERIRSMTFVGSAIPEVGVAFAPDGDRALQLRFVIPLAVLVTRHFGLQFRLAESLLFPRDRPFSFGVTFGLGVLFR